MAVRLAQALEYDESRRCIQHGPIASPALEPACDASWSIVLKVPGNFMEIYSWFVLTKEALDHLLTE